MIEFEGTFDKELVQTLAKRNLKKISVFFVIIILLMLLVGILETIQGNKKFGIGLLLGMLFLTVLYITLYITMIRYNQKSTIVSSETKCFYQFNEDDVIFKDKKGEEYEGYLKAKYSYFMKIVETKDNYFFYPSLSQVHIIKKSDITQGTIEEFNSLLIKKCGSKFKYLKVK